MGQRLGQFWGELMHYLTFLVPAHFRMRQPLYGAGADPIVAVKRIAYSMTKIIV
jgi:hypothetical protein